MDPYKNPFAPNAGHPPPELAGRSALLERADLALSRLKDGRPAKGLVLVGLRGVGKTVLLNRFEEMATQAGYHVVSVESIDAKRLEARLIPALRTLLLQLDRIEGVSEKVKRGLRVLQGFISKMKMKYQDLEFSWDVSPEAECGVADSGDLEIDLPQLMVAIGEAASARNAAVALLFDEMQYLTKSELSALIMAMHKVAQKQLPVILIGAGLPPLLGQMGNSKSYAERLFEYPKVDALDRNGVQQAVQTPIERANTYIERRAVDHIFNVTTGYPYFVQQWAYDAWNAAKGASIDLRAVQKADSLARTALDESFFNLRFDRLTQSERNYLRAMAYFRADTVKSGHVAAALGQAVQSVGPVRTSLARKGMIYSPSYGDTAFTVPHFGEFMRRKMPDWVAKS